jgi:hypothetical protein
MLKYKLLQYNGSICPRIEHDKIKGESLKHWLLVFKVRWHVYCKPWPQLHVKCFKNIEYDSKRELNFSLNVKP